MKNVFPQVLLLASLIAAVGCHTPTGSDEIAVSNEVIFKPEISGYLSEQKNLRKWGTPVVVDLDQDGWPDIIVNDHGYGVRVLWNDKGRIGKAYDLIIGDVHGVSVADFDLDGLLEIVVARGGGSGKNARNARIYRAAKDRSFSQLLDFPEPLIAMRGRTVKFYDANSDGLPDLLNFAFPATNSKNQNENYLYKNVADGTFQLERTLDVEVKGDGQLTLITDYNGDNIQDLLVYGNGQVTLHRGLGDFGYKEVGPAVFPEGVENVSSAVELDFDNDGDFDIYLTRAKSFNAGETFYDADTRIWGFYTRRGNFQFELKAGDILDLVNYQSPWPHKQVYIGESAYGYPFPGETHSGKDLRLVNSDSLGWPDIPEHQGLHVGYIGNSKWRIGGDVWSPTSGVVADIVEPPLGYQSGDVGAPVGMLLENRNGQFVDVTAERGLARQANVTGAVAADFDNNGFVDLLLVQRGNLVSATPALLYLNQAAQGFQLTSNHRIASTVLGAWGLGVEAVDYNRDGKVDVVFGSERGKWHVYENISTRSENFLIIDVGLRTPQAGKSTLGGLVSVEACGATQQRRVGSGSGGYERSYDQLLHFGLGGCTETVTISVRWTDGTSDIREVEARNSVYRLL